MDWTTRLRRWLTGRPTIWTARLSEAHHDEDQGWRPLATAGRDPAPADHQRQIAEATLAYQTNPLAFRIVELITDFVLGPGLTLSSPDPAAARFLQSFWTHPLNDLPARQFSLVTELSVAGELFLSLHTNPYDRMTYLRPIPAQFIDTIETSPEDLEDERRFHQNGPEHTDRWWQASEMRHYAINRLVGMVRGQSDLAPILPWLRRYRDWLTDRVRINRYKGAFLWEVELKGADRRTILQRQTELSAPPPPGSLIVHNENEVWRAIQPAIDAPAVEADGRALRLLIAAGAGLPLHYLGEPEGANRATAAEMHLPALRRLARRQQYVGTMFADLARTALQRAGFPPQTPVTVHVGDLAAPDSERTARALSLLVPALAQATAQGWLTAAEAQAVIQQTLSR